LEVAIALHFRDEFRDARAVALKDAEAFDQIVYVLERLGVYLTRRVMDLGKYHSAIEKEANKSPLAGQIPGAPPQSQTRFDALYDLVRQGRNDALHQGAFARHLTRHAIELALILEDALMADAAVVRDFMVKDPVCARLWQPLGELRRSMLENSFSFLPVAAKTSALQKWALVADFSVASYLRAAKDTTQRRERLAGSLAGAIEAGSIALIEAPVCKAEDHITVALNVSQGKPVLVIGADGDLQGIVTPFDLL
jgi:hypothetical protein